MRLLLTLLSIALMSTSLIAQETPGVVTDPKQIVSLSTAGVQPFDL